MPINDALHQAARQSFRELTARRDQIVAVSTPLREMRDAYVQSEEAKIATARAEMDAEIATAEDGLFDINQEIGRLVRFLDGKTGDVGTSDDLVDPDVKA